MGAQDKRANDRTFMFHRGDPEAVPADGIKLSKTCDQSVNDGLDAWSGCPGGDDTNDRMESRCTRLFIQTFAVFFGGLGYALVGWFVCIKELAILRPIYERIEDAADPGERIPKVPLFLFGINDA